jgi:uncharacterized membrane protein YfcA
VIAQGYPVAGFVVGLLVGLTGVGGGSLMTPLLILVFGVHPVSAVGTDLLQASLTKAVGTGVLGLARRVEWAVVGTLALGSMPMAGLTLWAAGSHLRNPGAQHVLSMALGAVVIITALTLLFRRRLMLLGRGEAERLSRRAAFLLTVAVGAVLGVCVTLTSVGAGALGMVALTFLYPRHATARLVAADIAHAVPLTMLAGLGHWLLGSVDLGLLGALLIGSVPGVLVGSFLVTRVPETVLRPVLAVLMLLAGSKLLT